MKVSYQAHPLGRPSPEAMEAVELFPWQPANFPSRRPQPKERIEVIVVTSKGTFRGGIRTYPTDGKDSVYLCPDLISERDSKKISLAKVLDEIGVKPGDTIDVDIVGNRWAI